MARWYRVGFYKDRFKDILGSNMVKLFFKSEFLIFFFIYLLRIVLRSLFYLLSLSYIDHVLYFVLFIQQNLII